MADRENSLRAELARSHEVNITVTGRKSGRKISIPVWFVAEGGDLYLLPVAGRDTQWYRNVLENPLMQIEARGVKEEEKAVLLNDSKRVASVVEKFRDKYGAGDVKKYYSKLEVAVVIPLR